MPAFASISKFLFLLAATLTLALPCASLSFAQEGESSTSETDRTAVPEEDDFSGTPFTEYGEFDEEQDEAEATRFFQYGRFFGVSVGVGFQGATGNRGALWQGGFPLVDVKVHYWFDFNFALDLNFFTAKHSYEVPDDRFDVTFSRIGLDLKYYFDTKNLSAPISFANPYVALGGGSYSKTEFATEQEITDSDSTFGVSAGAGVEFPLKPRKVYFNLEGKIHLASFKDTADTKYSDEGFDDLGGAFFGLTANFLFTW